MRNACDLYREDAGPDTLEQRDWTAALLAQAGLLAGSMGALGAAYWVMTLPILGAEPERAPGVARVSPSPVLSQRRAPRRSPGFARTAPVKKSRPGARPARGNSPRSTHPLLAAADLPAGAPAEAAEGSLAGPRGAAPPEGRCVVFVLDTSGAMRACAADARREILLRAQALGPRDRFNVVAFASGVSRFAETPVSPGEDSLAAVRAWLAALPEGQGDDLAGGLSHALATPGVSSVIVFSDGRLCRSAAQRVRLETVVRRENRTGAQLLAVVLGAGQDCGDQAAPRPLSGDSEPLVEQEVRTLIEP